MVRCGDAAANSFVAKIWGEVFTQFQVFTIKRHSSIWKLLSFLPG
jgi:hypothetical protein